MKQYNDLMRDILDNGVRSDDRTGVGTLSVFGRQLRFDLSKGFPAATTKRLAWKAVVGELLWFLEGNSDERRLAELTFGKPREELTDKKTIWTANAETQGRALGYECSSMHKELGPVYGVQWRDWLVPAGSLSKESSIDQIQILLDDLKNNPYSRRHILSAWNVGELPEMALPPCHVMSQFYVRDGKLSCLMFQRSLDAFLGGPFNIASYSLLTHMLARECGYEVGEFVYTIGDAHIYLNHIDQVKEQLSREPLQLSKLEIDPSFKLNHTINGFGFPLDTVEQIRLIGYQSHATIKAEMAV